MKITWPPKVTRGTKTRFSVDGTSGHANLDGTPTIIPLKRLHSNDKTARGELLSECCDCGLVHLYTFELVCKGEFYLLKRSHRIKDGRKLKQRTRKK